MTDQALAQNLNADDFFAGVLAGLALQRTRIASTRTALHRAFYNAVLDPTAGAFVDRKRLAIDFDPLYGVSPWLDRALTRAQRDLLVSFPNPTYDLIEIRFERSEAAEWLEEIGLKGQFVRLAKKILTNLESVPSR